MLIRRTVLAATLAGAAMVLAACETTPAPLATIQGVQPYRLTTAEFELVRTVVLDELAEPQSAFLHPNPAAARGGPLVVVCGLLNGTNRSYYTTDAVYIVSIDYSSGRPQTEILALGGSSRQEDQTLREFCRSELGIDI